MFAPDLRVKVTLPAKKKAELYCPSDDDVRKLLNHIKGTELEIAVLLAAFGPLRRGEICALTDNDVHGNTIDVSRSMVKGADHEWYVKQPKTYGSYRSVEFPDFVIDKIKNIKGPLVKSNPDYITHRFGRVLKTIDIPHFRFHDLRHPNVKPKTKSFSIFLEIFKAALYAPTWGVSSFLQSSHGALYRSSNLSRRNLLYGC